MSYDQLQGGYGAPPPPSYVGIGKRFIAALADWLVVFIGTIPGWIVLAIATVGAASTADSRGNISDDSAGALVGAASLAYLLIFGGALIVGLYDIYLLGRDGSTLGKRWMKIKDLDSQGQPLGFGKAFAHELVTDIGGLVVGTFVGFLLRPSIPLIGQLPFGVVITRGAFLQGLDQLMVSTAETSFDYLLIGAIIGVVIGASSGYLLDNRRAGSSRDNSDRGRGHLKLGEPRAEIDITEYITKLAHLKEKGVLTEEEFKAKKKELLNRL